MQVRKISSIAERLTRVSLNNYASTAVLPGRYDVELDTENSLHVSV